MHTNGNQTEALIDKFLDNRLSDKELEKFEIRCFENNEFFKRVQDRKKLRKKIKQVIEEDGIEIFSEDIEEDIIRTITKIIIDEVAPSEQMLFDHFADRYFSGDQTERTELILESSEYRSTNAGEAALTYLSFSIIESLIKHLIQESVSVHQILQQKTDKEFIKQHADELLKQYAETTKSYSSVIKNQVEKLGNYLKKLKES